MGKKRWKKEVVWTIKKMKEEKRKRQKSGIMKPCERKRIKERREEEMGVQGVSRACQSDLENIKNK
jgi:hypothetical protein